MFPKLSIPVMILLLAGCSRQHNAPQPSAVNQPPVTQPAGQAAAGGPAPEPVATPPQAVPATGASAGTTLGLSQSLISNSRTIRSSVGAGLVWDSILGPIRVDYAYPTTQAANDVTQRFRFSAGGFGF